MKTNINEWTIQDLYDSRSKILDQPKYQRGKVWSPIKKQMLIDSILRGIDIPKIYLRKLSHGLHTYEVADGQQRISAIIEFLDGKFKLSSKEINGLNLKLIGTNEVGGKAIDEIDPELKTIFLNYKLTIAEIHNASNEGIRTLFARLQMGDTLNPAEKRNAIISNLGLEIDNIVLNHDFFTKSKISPNRFKRQDYLTHVFAVLHYNNKHDLKAPLFNRMYLELAKSDLRVMVAEIVKTLDLLREIDKNSPKRIINKWSFVDLFRLLHQTKDSSKIDLKNFGRTFQSFENTRIQTKDPETLLLKKGTNKSDLELYNYIIAFKSNGGNPSNLDKRLSTFKAVFNI